ncbi:DNA/RNA helicase domain-containing protein [Streptomyces sp. SAS_270]|uniref:DNA/RNA helicase domain-containing protein n=1 Tax=Streptomyces sp. SAS_270 TaxID=3412748 RepID=UPI00403CA6CE
MDLLRLDQRRLLLSHLAARWLSFKKKEVSESEKEAWKESLIQLATDLVSAGRGDVRMLVECKPEGAKAAVDVVLVGRHPETDRESVLLVELKRWSSVSHSAEKPEKVVVPGMREPKRRPSDQLKATYEFFTGDEGPLKGMQIEFAGLSYLHNAQGSDVDPLFSAHTSTGPHALTITADTRADLLADLRERFAENGSASAAERVLQRLAIRNTPLLTAMVSSRGEDTVFTLRGEQRRVFRDIRLAVERLPANEERAVFVVEGGAGSGKSAIGLELLEHFSAAGRTVKYASGSRAFDAAMKKHVGYGDGEFQDRFVFFSSFITPPQPPLDLLICDEAHRLRERSTSRYLPEEQWGKQPQVDDLLDAARVTVFLLDGSQVVRPNEVGTVKLIRAAAENRHITPRMYELHKQFRCSGSDRYRDWVHDLLGISDREPDIWIPDGLMHIEVADSPEELERIILEENEAGASARMVAGFCWPWTPLRKDRTLEPDVRIGDWHRPWNVKGDRSGANDEPPAKLWGVRPEGVDQIGCVYTAQGLEWDWCGVIIGDDMVWREDHWEYRRATLTHDKEHGVRRVRTPGSADEIIRARSNERFDECVRNAYHVLLTRASRATVLYSTDAETQAYLKKLVGSVEDDGLRPTWHSLPPEARGVRLPPVPKGRRRRRKRPKAGPQDLQLSFDSLG